MPLWSAPMCHFAEVWHTLRRKAWSWSLQHQAGSHGGFISTSCSQTIGQFIRKRTAAAPAGEATDDEVGDAMRAAVKKARGGSSPQDTSEGQACGRAQDASKGNAQDPRPRRQPEWHRASLRSKLCQRTWEASRRST